MRTTLVVILTLALTSCAAPTEQTLLSQFFAASRLRDLTAVRNFATVVFEPNTDGIVTSFEVLGIAVTSNAGGQPMSEEVSISAPVKLPDGQTVPKTLVVTLRRGLPGVSYPGPWVITAIKAGPASPSTPRS